MAINLDSMIINMIVAIVVVSPALWLSGRLLVSKGKAKFENAVWIVVLGTIIGGVFGMLFYGVVASVIQLLIWLALVKHFFDCGWIKALAISALAVIIFLVIVAVLGSVGFGVWTWSKWHFPPRGITRVLTGLR